MGVVLYFRESAKMEAAYGLAIITTMIMTTILFANYGIAPGESGTDLPVPGRVYNDRVFVPDGAYG